MLQVHSVVFSNIPSYSSGTRPWSRQFGEQRLDDGLIEVIGLTTYQLPLIQAGGHGHCITQCRAARITTRKTIPMQVIPASHWLIHTILISDWLIITNTNL